MENAYYSFGIDQKAKEKRDLTAGAGKEEETWRRLHSMQTHWGTLAT
jgi:hypothetical protein